MARRASQEPTERELEILRVLWDAGSAGLADICQALRRERDVATTTVATVLNVMRGKRLVERTADRRWRPLVSRRATSTSMMRRLMDQLFDGSARRMVAQLLETGRLKPDDVAELRQLIDEFQPADVRPKDKPA